MNILLYEIFFLIFTLLICTLYCNNVFAKTKNVIYVYKDDGVSEESLTHTVLMFKSFLNKFLVKIINAKQVRSGEWIDDAALFAIPGGADVFYVKKLNGLGNKNIKRYVQEGGHFIGICAGAYYSSSYIKFDINGPLRVVGDRELSFFHGTAIGPILSNYEYETRSGSRAAVISTIFDKIPKITAYYNGGCFFENAEKFHNTIVLARYENELPAIIMIKFGHGKILLSGIHFEYDPFLLDVNDIYISKIINKLTQDNNLRKILTNKLLNILLKS